MVPVPVDGQALTQIGWKRSSPARDLWHLHRAQLPEPTAVTQSLKRRRQILELARMHNAYVIEDDIYADLRYGGHRVPSIKSLPGGEQVITLGSFSKSLAAGLRLGFLAASGAAAEGLRRVKEITDISSSTLSQALMVELLRSGFYRRHLIRVRRLYRQRRDAILQALESLCPTHSASPDPRRTPFVGDVRSPIGCQRALQRCLAQVCLLPLVDCSSATDRRSSSFRLNYASHSPTRSVKAYAA